jgi:phosphatidylglycerol:prolipoprotein diacylglycerol transferase
MGAMLAAWLHNLDPYAIKLWEGGPIRWYGLSYLAGFVIAYFVVRRVARCGISTLRQKDVGDLVFTVALGLMVGGRLGYVLFYKPQMLISFTASPPFWDVLAINKGGMASHGGMIGLVVACWIYARRHKHSFAHLLDISAFAAPLGVFCGRMANFVNGELFGRPTDVPWAVKFPQEILSWNREQLDQLQPLFELLPSPRPDVLSYDMLITAVQQGNSAIATAMQDVLPARHPSQIYEALLEGLLVFAVLAVVWLKPHKPMIIAGLFCTVYAIVRIVGEQFREPDDHLGFDALGLTRGQWLSVALLLAGVVLLVIFSRRQVAPMGGWRCGAGGAENAGNTGTEDAVT